MPTSLDHRCYHELGKHRQPGTETESGTYMLGRQHEQSYVQVLVQVDLEVAQGVQVSWV